MQDSQVNTISVPVIGTINPATLVRAANLPMRIVVRNVGPVTVFVAHNASEIQQIGATAGVFQIPPGTEDIFVLAPKQGLWAVSGGAIGTVCIAISEAITRDWGG